MDILVFSNDYCEKGDNYFTLLLLCLDLFFLTTRTIVSTTADISTRAIAPKKDSDANE